MKYNRGPYESWLARQTRCIQASAMRSLGRELDEDELAYMLDPSTILGPFAKMGQIEKRGKLSDWWNADLHERNWT